MMMEIVNLKKRYGKKDVLNGVSFQVDRQITGILGPNGAGKTTLLKIMAGLIRSTEGEIIYAKDLEVQDQRPEFRIGYLPQEFGLIKNYKLYEHMEYFACMKGIPREEWTDCIGEVLDGVNLSDAKDTKCGKLSGGMVRRAGIAQAFLGNPEVVLLDEPTAGLDPEERVRFQNFINHYKKKCAVVVSTHILDDVFKICDELLVLDKGKILYRGETKGLVSLAEDRVWLMSETESRHWQDYGVNVKTYCDEQENTVRFLYLGNGEYINPKAVKTDAQIDDGYLYLLKSEKKNDFTK